MAKKMHTRIKRRLNLTSSFGHKYFLGQNTKKVGAKTFRTEEQANEHATAQGLKDYKVLPAKQNKRFKISE